MSNFAGISGAQLRQFIEQVEYLEEQKASIASDIRDVFSEVKNAGFDVKIVREILKLRKMDHDERRERDEILDVYLQALERSAIAQKAAEAVDAAAAASEATA